MINIVRHPYLFATPVALSLLSAILALNILSGVASPYSLLLCLPLLAGETALYLSFLSLQVAVFRCTEKFRLLLSSPPLIRMNTLPICFSPLTLVGSDLLAVLPLISSRHSSILLWILLTIILLPLISTALADLTQSVAQRWVLMKESISKRFLFTAYVTYPGRWRYLLLRTSLLLLVDLMTTLPAIGIQMIFTPTVKGEVLLCCSKHPSTARASFVSLWKNIRSRLSPRLIFTLLTEAS